MRLQLSSEGRWGGLTEVGTVCDRFRCTSGLLCLVFTGSQDEKCQVDHPGTRLDRWGQSSAGAARWTLVVRGSGHCPLDTRSLSVKEPTAYIHLES